MLAGLLLFCEKERILIIAGCRGAARLQDYGSVGERKNAAAVARHRVDGSR
jgi:hypothetical protein